MPHNTIKLKPGVETTTTLALNEVAYSKSQLIRFLPERNLLGLAQKLGGWQTYISAAISSKIRALKGWSDLNSNNLLAIGAESSLSVSINGSSPPQNITPQLTNTDTTPNFVTSSTTNSNIVTFYDSNISATTLDYVNFTTPVSVGGFILNGPYALYTASGSQYGIVPGGNATTTVGQATFTGSISGTTLTASSVTGTIALYQTVTGTGVVPGTQIIAFVGGSGGAGTYTVNMDKTVSSTAMTSSGGVSYTFSSTANSGIITGFLPNNTFAPNDTVYVSTPTTIGSLDAGYFTTGRIYVILTVGTTTWTSIGAANNNIGTAFIATGAGSGTGKALYVPVNNVTGGSFVIGTRYIITYVGSTNFTLIGAASNTVGVVFTATGVGTGSGTATYVPTSNTTLSGDYVIINTPTTNPSLTAGQFTFAATTSGSITVGPTPINDGKIDTNWYITNGPQQVSSGFGVGGFGVGGYGVGTSQSQSSGTEITATDWTLDNFGQDLVACPAGGPIYYWNPSGQLQQAQYVGGNAPVVNSGIFVAMPERQVIAYGSSFTLAPDPMLVRWSDVEDFTVWNATVTNQAGSYRIPTGSKIVAGIQGPQQGLIWTDLDLWAMQYIGAPLVYGFNKIGSNCGAVSRHCIGQFNGAIYWMSQKQFFMSMGSGPQSIPCPIWDVIFQNINTSYLNKVACGVNSQFNEITWYYPSASSTENDSYVKYNTVLQQWDYGSLGRTAWIDQSVLGSPIGAGSDNYLYQHEMGNDAAYNGNNGQPMLSSFQTGYFQLNEADNLIFIDQIWPDMKWGTYSGSQNATVQITFYVTNYPGDTPTQYGPYTMTQATEYISVRIRARLMSISVSSTDTGTFWRLGAIRYRYQQDGRF
jgi:hypothetical protein